MSTVHKNAPVSFSELRSNAARYFDAVEAGERVRVSRNGKIIAEIVPISATLPAWKHAAEPLVLREVSLGVELLLDRANGR